MNEAPGPSEAASGIPSFGQQGANVFHALRNAGISWAIAHQKFVWPINVATQLSERHRQKAAFLKTRAHHITCTNAFPRWPKPSHSSDKFCPPRYEDVVSVENITRIRSELQSTHRAILICGTYAYLACLGKNLSNPSTREATELTSDEIDDLNERLNSHFEKGWYMGHTRRWSTQPNKIASTLRLLAEFLDWPVDTVNSRPCKIRLPLRRCKWQAARSVFLTLVMRPSPAFTRAVHMPQECRRAFLASALPTTRPATGAKKPPLCPDGQLP